jgi:uncharacterized membrane protein
MNKRTQWIIGIATLLSLLTIVTPVYFYIKDFHEFSRSTNPNDWGTFGDFMGGVLNPIISLLTLVVTIIIAINISRIEKRNHEETVHSPVKPLFTIWTGDFFSSNISQNGLSIEKDYYDYVAPEQAAGPHDYLTKRFYLKILNKGLGVATQVNITFEIDLKELKKLLTIDEARIKVTTSEIRADEEGRRFIIVSINSDHFGYQGSSKIWEIERYGLDIIDKGDEVKAYIPSQILSAFQLTNLICRFKYLDLIFPIIFVKIEYKNIHEKPLNSKFKVGLQHIHDYGDFALFRIIQEQY